MCTCSCLQTGSREFNSTYCPICNNTKCMERLQDHPDGNKTIADYTTDWNSLLDYAVPFAEEEFIGDGNCNNYSTGDEICNLSDSDEYNFDRSAYLTCVLPTFELNKCKNSTGSEALMNLADIFNNCTETILYDGNRTLIDLTSNCISNNCTSAAATAANNVSLCGSDHNIVDMADCAAYCIHIYYYYEAFDDFCVNFLN